MSVQESDILNTDGATSGNPTKGEEITIWFVLSRRMLTSRRLPANENRSTGSGAPRVRPTRPLGAKRCPNDGFGHQKHRRKGFISKDNCISTRVLRWILCTPRDRSPCHLPNPPCEAPIPRAHEPMSVAVSSCKRIQSVKR